MQTIVTVIHIVLCVVLMIVILLQAGKGAEIGAVFGGSSQTIFGSRGAASLLSKVTAYCAIGFMITSLSLVFINSKGANTSIMDEATRVEEGASGSDMPAGDGEAEGGMATSGEDAQPTPTADEAAAGDAADAPTSGGDSDTPSPAAE